jgi:PKD repeat protein
LEVSELPAKVRFSAGNSSATYTDQLTYIWNLGDGSPLLHGADIRYSYANAGLYTVQLTVRNQDGVESTDTATIWVPDSACYRRESDTNCLSVLGSFNNIIDKNATSLVLSLNSSEALISSLPDEESALNIVLNSGTNVDLKGRFTVSGNQLILETSAILETVSNGDYFTLEFNGQTVNQDPIYATLDHLRISAGELKIFSPPNARLLEITGLDIQQTTLSPVGEMIFNKLPRGTYTATVYFNDDSSSQRVVSLVNGVVEIDFNQEEPIAQALSSQKMSSLNSSMIDPTYQQAVELLESRPWPTIKNPVSKMTSLTTTSMTISQGLISTLSDEPWTHQYYNFCGQLSPFNIVTTAPNGLDTSLPIEWGDFLASQRWLEDPNTRNVYRPLGNLAQGESSIKVRCELQSPSMQHQFNEWYRTSSKQQCCNPTNTSCAAMVDQIYADLTKDYSRDDHPIVYKMKFRDIPTGHVVERSSSFTFSKVAAAIGYSRGNMTSILGLPAHNFVDGWSVPHEFEISLPKGMSEIEYAVDISSTYPNEQFRHAYYCWTGKRNGPVIKVGIAAEEPLVEIVPPAIIGPLSIFGMNSMQAQNATPTPPPIPNEHDSLLATPSNNMWRLSQYKLFPMEIDGRTSGNTYPTSAQAYEIETKVRVEVLDYGTSKQSYQAISKIAMQPISTYVPAGSTQSVAREGTLNNITGLICTATATKTACEGKIRLSPSQLNIPQGDINEVKVDSLSITLKPTFYNQADSIIDTGAEVNNTLELGPQWKNSLEVSALYDISPSTPASSRRCADRYGNNTIAFAKNSLVKIVQNTLNPMTAEGFSVRCNDASLPFGGKLFQTCTVNGTAKNDCTSVAFPHKGKGHSTGIALDTLDLMKNANLQGSFATNKGARKISAALIMVEYVRDVYALDSFCSDKQLAPYPPLNTSDPDLKCQDEIGARRFTGRECFMNLEKILSGLNPENAPDELWNWDPENSSSLPRSRGAAKWCPFLSDTTKLAEVRDYVNYTNDAGGGLIRYKTLLQSTGVVIFTFGVKDIGVSNTVALDNWNETSLLDGTFPFKTTFPISNAINYPLFQDGIQLINRRQLAPRTIDSDGHLDHLHLEVRQ